MYIMHSSDIKIVFLFQKKNKQTKNDYDKEKFLLGGCCLGPTINQCNEF